MAKFAPIYMSVYDGPEGSLDALVIDNASFAKGAAEDTPIGTLSGMMDADSVVSIVGGDGEVKLDGDAVLVGPNAPTEAGTFSVTFRETNAYGDNSPLDTEIEFTVTE